jgi:hypothetical protein
MATLCGTDAALVPEGREADAVQALLLALHLHFPSFYRRHLARSRLATRLYPAAPTGRQIRLARIATRRLAEYL